MENATQGYALRHHVHRIHLRKTIGRKKQNEACNINMSVSQNYCILKSFALIATMIVDNDIRTAPMAGLSTNPEEYNTPAANGMVIAL